jgi:hypothetical protein
MEWCFGVSVKIGVSVKQHFNVSVTEGLVTIDHAAK